MKTIKRTSVILLLSFGLIYYLVANPIVVFKKSERSYEVSATVLEKHVLRLCGTEKPRNFQNLESLNEAADYIHQEFDLYTERVEEQVYEVKGNDFKNIIASFGPEEGKRLIVGAHYDVCYDQPGADDNASGVAGLLEIARMLNNKAPKIRVDLVAYTLEEPPFFRSFQMGSAMHAQYCSQNNLDIEAMICLEMIGYFDEEKGSQDYPVGIMKAVYPSNANYIAIVGKMGHGALTRKMKRWMSKGSDIDVRSINAPESVPGIDFSDHLHYWQRGYDAVMITNTAFYRNKNYHEKTDTPETLNFNKMSEVVKGVTHAIYQFE